MYRTFCILTVVAATACAALAQAPAKTSFIGTVSAVAADTVEVTPDGGSALSLKITSASQLQRVAAGEKSLKNAQAIQLSEVAKGDRVLVNLSPDLAEVRRIVVMSSDDIRKRNEADRMDWTRRGVSGVVVSKAGNQITVRTRSMAGEQRATVKVADTTRFKRYAPDSVAFTDAKASSIAEVSQGDQIRARGTKSETGLEVDAEEVVFGTFLTKAGVVKSVDTEAKQITIEDIESRKPVVIAIRTDSQLKKLPDFAAMMGGGGAGARPMGGGTPPAGAGPRAGGAPDMSQMLERMPSATLADVKPGQTIVVSSTKGAKADRLTAIMLVANADFLIRMATMRSGGGAADPASPGLSPGPGGMNGMMGELQLPGMMP